MAFTDSSVKVEPITVVRPRYGKGGMRGAVIRSYPVNVTQTIRKGDIVVLTARRASRAPDNADFNGVTALGIAVADKSTGAAVTEDDIVQVYDAASNIFEANFVTNETADLDTTTNVRQFSARPLGFCNVLPASTNGQWCIFNATAVNDDALMVGLARNMRTFDHGGELAGSPPNLDVGDGISNNIKFGDKFPINGAHTGILNARVHFVFVTVDPSIGPPATS